MEPYTGDKIIAWSKTFFIILGKIWFIIYGSSFQNEMWAQIKYEREFTNNKLETIAIMARVAFFLCWRVVYNKLGTFVDIFSSGFSTILDQKLIETI